jgi:hypothetical protein
VGHKRVVEALEVRAALVCHRDDRNDLAAVSVNRSRPMYGCNFAREVDLRQWRPQQLQPRWKMSAVVEQAAGAVAVRVVD